MSLGQGIDRVLVLAGLMIRVALVTQLGDLGHFRNADIRHRGERGIDLGDIGGAMERHRRRADGKQNHTVSSSDFFIDLPPPWAGNATLMAGNDTAIALEVRITRDNETRRAQPFSG